MVLSVCGNNFRIISSDCTVGLESVFQQSGFFLFAEKKRVLTLFQTFSKCSKNS